MIYTYIYLYICIHIYIYTYIYIYSISPGSPLARRWSATLGGHTARPPPRIIIFDSLN